MRAAGLNPNDLPFPAWLANCITTPERRRYSFDGRPYMVAFLEDLVRHPYVVSMKPSQFGLTLAQLLALIYMIGRAELPAGAVYFFPTDNDVRDLSKTKAEPLLRMNYFAPLCPQPGDVFLKKVGGCNLFFRGTVSTVRMKMLSADIAVFDEADDISPEALEIANERIDASPLKWQRHFSRPSIPGYGIARAFDQSDQHYWTFRCRRCRKEFDLATRFPDTVAERENGAVDRCCPDCHTTVRVDEGRWVARNPGSDVRGYHFTQLLGPSKTPKELLAAFRATSRKMAFLRGKIGLACSEAGARLTKDQVLDCKGVRPRATTCRTPTFFGADVGAVIHWVAVQPGEQRPRVVGLGTVNEFEDLGRLYYDFSMSRSVVDVLPETRKAIEHSRTRKGKVHLCWYDMKKEEPPKWSHDDDRDYWKVSTNRTERFDMVFDKIRKKGIELPALDAEVEVFAEHFTKLLRADQENEDGTVSASYVPVDDGVDHYAHATLYALTAMGETRTTVVARNYAG